MFAHDQVQVKSIYLLKNAIQFVPNLIGWSVLITALLVVVKWTSQRRVQQLELDEPGSDFSRQPNSYHRWKVKLSMKMVARTTLLLLAFGIVASIFISFFISKIATDKDANNLFVLNQTLVDNDRAVTLNDQFENLFWFIQISDIHFSFSNDRNRKVDLQDFCHQMIPLVNPTVLVLSGDITDSRSPDPMGSDQYIAEWHAYNETRIKCLNYNPSITWLDIRGNHGKI